MGWLGKKTQILRLQSPWMRGWKVRRGRRGGEGRGGAFKESPVDTTMVIFEAGLHLVLHCLVLKKISNVKGFWEVRVVVGASENGLGLRRGVEEEAGRAAGPGISWPCTPPASTPVSPQPPRWGSSALPGLLSKSQSGWILFLSPANGMQALTVSH